MLNPTFLALFPAYYDQQHAYDQSLPMHHYLWRRRFRWPKQFKQRDLIEVGLKLIIISLLMLLLAKLTRGLLFSLTHWGVLSWWAFILEQSGLRTELGSILRRTVVGWGFFWLRPKVYAYHLAPPEWGRSEASFACFKPRLYAVELAPLG